MASDLRRDLRYKIREFDKRLKNSFEHIKQDLNASFEKVNNMASYLKDWDKKTSVAWKNEENLRLKFKEQVEEFNQKISQLRLALSSIKTIKNEVVVMRDLAKIEEKIKTSFKNEIDSYKEEVGFLKQIIKENQKAIKTLEKNQEKLSRQNPKVIEKVRTIKVKQKKPRRKINWSFFSNFED